MKNLHLIAFCLGMVLGPAFCAAGERPENLNTYFGFVQLYKVSAKHKIPGNMVAVSNPFLGYFENKSPYQFKAAKPAEVVKQLKLSASYRGVSTAGSNTVTINRIDDYKNLDENDTILGVSVKNVIPSVLILFQTSHINTFMVKSEKQSTIQGLGIIKKKISSSIRKRILTLHKYKKSWFELGTPTIYNFPDYSSKTFVYYPFVLFRKSSVETTAADNRGSAFLIVSRHSNIEHFSIGHPELSPSAENFEKIVPRLFFSVGKSKKLFMVADYNRAWEYRRVAIYDLNSEPFLQGIFSL